MRERSQRGGWLAFVSIFNLEREREREWGFIFSKWILYDLYPNPTGCHWHNLIGSWILTRLSGPLSSGWACVCAFQNLALSPPLNAEAGDVANNGCCFFFLLSFFSPSPSLFRWFINPLHNFYFQLLNERFAIVFTIDN